MDANIVSVPQKDYEAPQNSFKRMDFFSGYYFRGKLIEWLTALGGMSAELPLERVLGGQIVKIIDVGARHGFHKRWKQFNQCLRIFLFEPDPIAYQELLEIYRGDSGVKSFNTALSSGGENLKIHVTASPDSSSPFEHDQAFFSKLNMQAFFKPDHVVEIGSKKLSDVLSENVDFIKLDVEGFELPILKGASDEFMDHLIGIEAEVSYVPWAKGIPLFGEVDAFCRSKGFGLCNLTQPGQYHYSVPDSRLDALGYVVSGDALYFRSPEQVVQRILDKRWELSRLPVALTVYLAYGNTEFAYVLLQEAVKAGLTKVTDSIYVNTLDLICRRSGSGKLFSYRVIRQLKRTLRVPMGLDF